MQETVMGVRQRLPLKLSVHAGGNTGSIELLDAVVHAFRLVISANAYTAPILRDGREEVWRRMYGSKPMPKRRQNVAMEYSGSEGRDLNLTEEDVDDIFEQLNNE
ncbi:MAG: hypothetical protein MPJ04_01225 [Nitrosopumilus sp.]|nr:hypothetical protein [Nitrosopumilus sp.]MDA7944433.1 hypothetical protein [Nitrosopumilus sp.]MDA7954185.1 hypothetical protein [Nitrosopumilus sp.]MDA7959460.1 hypothetical protein [Nitrosopumilus sp.]MDA7973219.1 hypothetical protein [Nitrosopumilus sp.]